MSKQTKPSTVFGHGMILAGGASFSNEGDAEGQVPLQTSAEFVRSYDAQAHEVTNAITAMVIHAQAGLHLLRAQSPNLEEVRRALNSIANDGKRAGDIVVRTRALMRKVAAANGASDPCAENPEWPV